MKNKQRNIVLFLIVALNGCGIVFLLSGKVNEPGGGPTPCPYYFVDRLEDAVEIDTPLPRLMKEFEQSDPLHPIGEKRSIKRVDVSLVTRPWGGRLGSGSLSISSPRRTDSATASLGMNLDEGLYLLSGYTRYQFQSDLDALDASDFHVPEARISWEALKDPPESESFDLHVSAEGLSRERQKNRSSDLLGIMMHWRVSKKIGEWNYFELPFHVPKGGRGLRFFFECTHLRDEVVFSDLRITRQSFASGFLREGDYRYLPSTEFTRPLKKVYRLGTVFRTCLAAFPPSRFVFDLALPERPMLEFHTGIARKAAENPAGAAEFIVTARAAGSKAEEVLHRSTRKIGNQEDAWRTFSLDLSSFGGKKIRLCFEVKHKDPGSAPRLPAFAPLFGTPVLYDRVLAKDRPHVLLLSIDCTRADRLGTRGYPRDCTAALDEIARRGFDFMNAYSPSDLTYVVMPMLMTGRMIKFRWLGSYNVLDSAIPSLTELLSREGYLCGGFCSDYYYNAFWKGFPFRLYLEDIPNQQKDEMLLDEALRFIRAHGDTPLFTWVHLNGPHPPCNSGPPNDYYLNQEGLISKLSDLQRVLGRGDDQTPWASVHGVMKDNRKFQPETIREAIDLGIAVYDGELRLTDRRIKGFLDALKKEGTLDRTLLIATSDHGIQLSKEAFYGRGPFEDGMRVPLIMAGPGLPSPPRRVEERISTIDLTPTLLEILKIPAPPGMTGSSLLPLCRGESANVERAVISLTASHFVVWFDDYKYLVSLSHLDDVLGEGSNINGPPLPGEQLYQLPPEGKGDGVDLKKVRGKLLLKGRKILADHWNSLDAASARGPANQALVDFFKKAGYMK